MSIRCQNWVYEYSEATGNDRLVLLTIADEADDDGTNAYPGVDRIAHKARLPKRTVMRCIDRLEEMGALLVHRPEQRGRGRFNTYEVVMKGDTLTPITAPPKRVQKGRETARKGAPPYLNRSRPPDPETQDPCPEDPAGETEEAATYLRAGSEVQEPHPADRGDDLLADVANAAPAACRWELLDDPDQAAGRSALRRRLDLLAAEVGPESTVAIVAGDWPSRVDSAMAHANGRARTHLRSRRAPDPLDGIADATAALAERAATRHLELADEPLLGSPPPSWKDHLLARLHGSRTDA